MPHSTNVDEEEGFLSQEEKFNVIEKNSLNNLLSHLLKHQV